MPIIKKDDVIKQGVDPLLELKKSLKETNDLVVKLTKSNENLSQSIQLVKKTSDGAEAKKLITATNELKRSNQELTGVQKERIKIRKQLDSAIAKSQVVEELNTKQLAKAKILTQEKQKLDKLQIQIDKAQAGSIEKLRLETRKLTIERDKLGNTTGKNAKQFKNLTAQINKNNTTLKAQGKAIGNNTRDVGNYRAALKGVGTQLLGAAGIVGGVQLLITGFTKLVERSNVLTTATKRVENIFKVSTQAAKGLSATIVALANNFDEDYNEILKSANAVSKEFGISADESLKLIEEGFKKGSNNSGEFLDILREYPAQLQSVGLNAEESFAIINQQVRAGVYSDKGIDAIKEAGIALRENTKAVQDALAPLEEQTRLEIEREVAAGNTFKAMQLISQAMEDTNLTASQTQAIMSDVFKGAGEDSLTFIQNLHNIDLSLEDVAEQTSYVENRQLSLSKTWNRFVSGVSNSEGIFAKVWGTIIALLDHSIMVLTEFLTDIGLFDGEGAKTLGKIRENVTTTKGAIDELSDSQKKLLEQERKRAASDIERQRIENLREQARLLQSQLRALSQRDKLIASQTREDIPDELPIIEETEEVLDLQAKMNDSYRAVELEKEKEQADAIKAIRETAVTEGVDFASNLFAQDQDSRLARVQSDIEAEKALLKDKLDKGLINEIQFNRQIADLNKRSRREEARAEKKKALFDIGIKTAVAVVSALARGGFIAALRAGAIGLVQAGFVAARPLPSFFEGTESVPLGGNKRGRDTIPAMLNEGERVVPTAINAQLNGVPNKDLPGLVNKGIAGNNNYTELIRSNEKIASLISNLGWTYPTKSGVFIIKADGSEVKKVSNG